MKKNDPDDFFYGLENSDATARIGAFIIACCLIFLLLVSRPWNQTAFSGFFSAMLVGPSLLLCYAGVPNPITKTFCCLFLVFAGPLSLISDMDTPVDAHLKGDTSNPNYWRYNKK